MMTGTFSSTADHTESETARQIIVYLRTLCELTRHCLELLEQDELACLTELLAKRQMFMDLIDRLTSRADDRTAETQEKRDWLFTLASLDAALKQKADEKMRLVQQVLKTLYDQPDVKPHAANGRLQGRLLDLLS